ncbi:DNA glycosylase AlkZ-like family protein [Candidatus Lokiarchaeum ossiferum]|uniref:DNA glycosylase AlkZ-like family protein n=1 Tax=Candidatus Lokiarchaeum ossiferum TaxID=2951803 RepID=UPI00352D7835
MPIQLDDLPTISKSQLQKLFIVGTHLHKWQNKSSTGIEDVFAEQGFVQIDPLNPAGRNHDHFFLSRMPQYQQGMAEKQLYTNNVLFESYFHSLNMISMKYFPIFYCRRSRQYLHDYYLRQLKVLETNHPQLIPKVKKYMQSKGPLKIDDVKQFGKPASGDTKWTTNSFRANILEILWALGELKVVKRDENFRKYFDFIEKYVNPPQLKRTQLSDKLLYNKRMSLFLHSFPVIASKITVGKADRLRLPRGKKTWVKLLDSPIENLIETKSRGKQARFTPNLVYYKEKKRIYFVPQSWESMCEQDFDSEMRAIAPLDPLIWDRDILQDVFNFEYKWEVYTPIAQRKWGYYVYPLLFKGKFIGRLEAKKLKKSSELMLSNFQPIPRLKYNSLLKNKFAELASRWEIMIGADSVKFDESFSKLLN